MTADIGGALAAMDGAELPGGCDECDAYQTLKTEGHNIFTMTVHHDDWCPALARHRSGRRNR